MVIYDEKGLFVDELGIEGEIGDKVLEIFYQLGFDFEVLCLICFFEAGQPVGLDQIEEPFRVGYYVALEMFETDCLAVAGAEQVLDLLAVAGAQGQLGYEADTVVGRRY